ncbi:Sec-independent protein translocase subunit TatA [Streptomyces sp. NPDC004667]|uniref:Sec-independent protein translocase subunit TatA n=1 Tax=Streptomyces sp. NPDC004667 TaxID=3154285 RepID=UPI0033B27E9F
MLRNGLEPWHLIIVLVVCLLVFGSKKLPDMARSLGKSARILKSEARAMRTEDAARPEARPETPAESRAETPAVPTSAVQPPAA